MPPDDQDEIARLIIELAGAESPTAVSISDQEREAIARSKAAAGRGEFATEEEVRAVWPGAGSSENLLILPHGRLFKEASARSRQHVGPALPPLRPSMSPIPS